MHTAYILAKASAEALAQALKRALIGLADVEVKEAGSPDTDVPLPAVDTCVVILPHSFSEAEEVLNELVLRSGDAKSAVVLGLAPENKARKQGDHLRLLAPRGADLYLQLPLSRQRLREHFKRLKDFSPGNLASLREALRSFAGRRQDTSLALRELASVPYDEVARLVDEHAVLTAKTRRQRHKACYNYQRRLDHYYLATGLRPPGEPTRTILVVDDRPEKIMRELRLLANVSGDRFIVMRDWETLLNGLKSDPKGITLRGEGESVEPRRRRSQVGPLPEPDGIDAVLFDLLFEKRKRGIEAIRVFTERCPEVPCFLTTWSEEPDVVAEAMRESGACGYIPKRRLVRFPYELDRFLYHEISPVLPQLADAENGGSARLRRRLIGAVRSWTTYPALLWHGEKTFHAAEHAFEHHVSLMRLANQLFEKSWDAIKARGGTATDLFRFFMALWLHDIGCKGNREWQSARHVRDRHAWLSMVLIHENPTLYRLAEDDTEERDHVARLCGYHQSKCPLESLNQCDAQNKELFSKFGGVLRECQAGLLPWVGLLRLLDAIDHQWKRVGTEAVSKAKQATLDADYAFYRDPPQEAGEKLAAEYAEYADWLFKQKDHIEKHFAVLGAQLHLEQIGENQDGKVIWGVYPCYRFASSSKAQEHLAEIGCYVLKEWRATGQYIEKLGLRIPEREPFHLPRRAGWYPVWNSRDISATIINAKGSGCSEKEQEQAERDTAWKVWKDFDLSGD